MGLADFGGHNTNLVRHSVAVERTSRSCPRAADFHGHGARRGRPRDEAILALSV